MKPTFNKNNPCLHIKNQGEEWGGRAEGALRTGPGTAINLVCHEDIRCPPDTCKSPTCLRTLR